jgi:hypothetical protein
MPAQCCFDFWEKTRRENPDVPVFTLIGYDQLAADTVAFWIQLALYRGVNADKLTRAVQHWDAIREYQAAHPEKVKLPD